jgi:HEPN/RES N-terminal domain 1/RES domain
MKVLNMGLAKRHYEEMMDPDRLEPQPNLYVSAACFADKALKKFARQNLTHKTCSYYCGEGKPPKGAPLDTIIRFVFDGICTRYDDANNGVGWDGGYVGAVTYDSDDLIQEHINLTENASPCLLSDIAGALPDKTWSAIDPYGARGHEILYWSWEKFIEIVKHERRYFFDNTDQPLSDEHISPNALLKVVANKCKQARMIRRLPAGSTFYRCRFREEGQQFEKPLELGPPPKDCASQSRMSPAGITMFYGAKDEATARAETLNRADDHHSMALFALGKDVTILDLTQSPVVSIFDAKHQHLYNWAIFMHKFREDLSKTIMKDNRVHIEYIPTQIITEYFRTYLKDQSGKRIDGILYRSATPTKGKCIALFADSSDVAPTLQKRVDPANGYLLQLLSASHHG